MDLAAGLLQGFQVALTPMNLAMCVVGVVLGTIIGVMPGWAAGDHRDAPAAHVQARAHRRHDHARGHLLRREVRRLDHVDPAQRSGESASVVTCLDGYAMARKGRAGPALGIAAIASFIAGTFGVVALMLVAPPLAKLSLAFSAPEYFALMVFGLAMVVLLAGESLVKALLAMFVGLWIATMGTDLFSATSRFTFDAWSCWAASTSSSWPSASSRWAR
jgi:putative tricarboxylic transport membrane protein